MRITERQLNAVLDRVRRTISNVTYGPGGVVLTFDGLNNVNRFWVGLPAALPGGTSVETLINESVTDSDDDTNGGITVTFPNVQVDGGPVNAQINTPVNTPELAELTRRLIEIENQLATVIREGTQHVERFQAQIAEGERRIRRLTELAERHLGQQV
jgi:hypothetical protein